MEEFFLPGLLLVTSLLAYVIGVRALGRAGRELGSAVRQACELAGLTVIFLLVNLGVGLTAILVTRAFLGRFISVYVLNDITLVAVSALQALLFACWRRAD